MYSAFVLIPQFVQTPTSTGYGFGSSVTQAGLFLIPSTIDDDDLGAARRPALEHGRLEAAARRWASSITMLALVLLAVAHSSHWEIYVASLLLGIGVGLAFASMTNLIVEAVSA